MKKIYLAIAVAAATMVLWVGGVPAQGAEATPDVNAVNVANLFAWASGPSPDWKLGALFSVLGVIGALVTIFGLIGGAVPGTAGQAKIDANNKQLEKWTGELERMITAPDKDPEVIKAVESTVNNLRDDIRAEMWRQFALAAFIYAILGGFFAALLARDMLQALVVGAGWTGFLGSLGLKSDFKERKAIKDDAIEKIFDRVGELEKENDELRRKLAGAPQNAPTDTYYDNLTKIENQVFRARAV
ncbi:MAG TPA: hypothetical protein HA257_04780 [Candidatus Methanoperedenaceae archaeon]|nr:hypothetical protein [Candidatus Methanoperedenaceae archaeon]